MRRLNFDNSCLSSTMDNSGREQFVVQGTDGWKLVTHDRKTAIETASKSTRNFGDNRVTY